MFQRQQFYTIFKVQDNCFVNILNLDTTEKNDAKKQFENARHVIFLLQRSEISLLGNIHDGKNKKIITNSCLSYYGFSRLKI